MDRLIQWKTNDPSNVDFIVYHLKGKGYVEGGGPMGPSMKITMAGRNAVEQGLL